MDILVKILQENQFINKAYVQLQFVIIILTTLNDF